MNARYLDRDEGKIAFDVDGSGPPVICAPSMGDVRAEYRFLTPRLLQAGYTVATTDLRGLGESSSRWRDFSVSGVGSDMIALIQHLDAGPAIVIGNSMAGGAAVWAAAEAPGLVQALVLIDPFVRDFPGFMNYLYPVMFADPWGPGAWVRYYSTLYPGRQPADFDAYRASLRSNLSEPGRMRALREMLKASKAASEARLPKVAAPALIVMGSRDPDFKDPAAEARLVAERIHGTVQMIEGAGHYPHAEMPDVCGSIIVSFLQTVTEPSSAL
jgi:pimeloyl-ACP methyl ester carboxylesterase